MSINSAMLAGSAGLRANASALAAISDNISNVNTVGFKRLRNDFTSLVLQQHHETTYNAGGVSASSRALVGEQGALQSSSVSTHLAISGDGFFVTRENGGDATVSDPFYYTRAGQFSPDTEGYLRNAAGYYLYGWSVEDDGSVTANPSDVNALQPVRMPKKLLVIGSGAIGIEFASFYNTLGADTTVVEVMDRVLPVEDAEISAFAKKAFVKQGMKIMEKAMVKQLDRGEGKVTAHIEVGGKIEKQEFDTVISAVGIVGNVEGLGLEALGVNLDRTHVVTDEFCRTGVEGLYAIGDIAGAPWLAHKASHEGVMVAELIAGKHAHPVKPESIAGCTYCHPQVASVGYTEAKAKELGYDIKVGRFPFIGNGKAIALGEAEGMVKTVFDAKTGELLGAHMVGAEVTEMIQGYVVGRQLETTEEDLMNTVFPHPTLSEMMHESVLDAFGRVIHM